jgi:hypothetical protein
LHIGSALDGKARAQHDAMCCIPGSPGEGNGHLGGHARGITGGWWIDGRRRFEWRQFKYWLPFEAIIASTGETTNRTYPPAASIRMTWSTSVWQPVDADVHAHTIRSSYIDGDNTFSG